MTSGKVRADFGQSSGKVRVDFRLTLGKVRADFGPSSGKVRADFGQSLGKVRAMTSGFKVTFAKLRALNENKACSYGLSFQWLTLLGKVRSKVQAGTSGKVRGKD